MPWHITLLTLFPEMFPGPLGSSVPGRALEQKKWTFDTVQIRDFATDNYRSVDDTPFGGGAGMIMRPDIIEDALLSVTQANPSRSFRKVYPGPRGRVFNQTMAAELAQETEIIMLCGRYEGVDQRVLDAHGFEEISIGDYVLFGGEVAAMVMMEACIRIIPGVVGNDSSPDEESFTSGLLEYPQYTRPAKWESKTGQSIAVPDVLRSGNHKQIYEWRKEKAVDMTKRNRPDLIDV